MLSVYIGPGAAEPSGTRRPVWEEQARTALHQVLHDAQDHAAVRRCLGLIAPALERALDADETGRGRAVFASVAGGEVEEVHIRPQLPTGVWLGERAHVVPLVAAIGDGAPVGLVVISMHQLRILELELGEVRDLTERDVTPPRFEWSLRKEPTVGVMEDRRRIAAVGTRLAVDRALQRGWRGVVVAGNERLAAPVVAELIGHGLDVTHVRLDPAPEHTPAVLAAELTPAADDLRRGWDVKLVERITDQARSGARGALGLADVLEALAGGRVAQLAIDRERAYPGALAPDGRAVPPGVVPVGLAGQELRPLPDLADHLVAAAFDTDADVTAVTGRAAEALAAGGGIGGLLRW